ncbi:MAG: hypothetical protein QOJ62_1813, partial [Actinomycetota bacterium]|nr:hypothetical protein [Actinomycetota bacterium]
MSVGYHWSIHQLTEYFDAVSRPAYEAEAIEVAVERAAEALDAEIGAVVDGGQVAGCIGFGPMPAPDLSAVAAGAEVLDVEHLGSLFAVNASLGSGVPGTLVVARARDEFNAEERQMLQGMARVLGLALRNLR